MTRPSSPPKPPFVLSVGITGHRAARLDAETAASLRERLGQALDLLRDASIEARKECEFFAGPDCLRLVSPLADGTDQIAAEVALERGWQLQAMLPFDRATYRASLGHEADRERFDALSARAASLFELPGAGGSELEAYVMAGRGTVAHCDVLIAVWDGQPARGRGGTAEVVQLALMRGTAVIHLNPDSRVPGRMLWSGFDPNVLTIADDPGAARSFDFAYCAAALRGLLSPPTDPDEREFIRRFQHERSRRIRTRIEYPLMLAVTGVGRFGAKDFRNAHCEQQIREEWERHWSSCATAHAIDAPVRLLEEAYSRADALATHFAQTYRSGHIFGFLLGSLAVCIGLSAFMAPRLKLEFAVIELFITLAVIANAWIGTRNEWHRRWLDYRQLAERLRPMRSLKLFAIAAPDPPGTTTNPTPRRWIEWYAAAIWRAIGTPSGTLDATGPARLAKAVADHEVAPQVGYHRRNAERVEKLDGRLEKIGFGLFAATFIVSLLTIVGMAGNARFVDQFGDWFTLVSAGFPALGTAVFGIRFQADFGGDALRSLATATTLERIDEELRGDVSLTRAADLAEQASRVMLADLDEWRLVNQQRELEMG